MGGVDMLSIVMLVFQVLIASIGGLIILMTKRILTSIDALAQEDKNLRELIHSHREDTLLRMNSMETRFWTMNGNDRRKHNEEG